MKRDLSILCSWMIRYIHVLIVFILFPLFIFTYGSVAHQNESSLVVASPVQSIVEEVSASRILSQQEASYLENINNNISNNWTSDTDEKYELRINPNNSFDEYYDGDKFGWGQWRVYSATSTATSSVVLGNIKPLQILDNGDVYKFYLEKSQEDPDSKGEKYIYQVYVVDAFKLALVRVDNGKVLSFVRSTSTVSKKSHQ